MPSHIIAEWADWEDWSDCSMTCDYGIRQRSRGCIPAGQCAGLGMDMETEYCTNANELCTGIVLGKSVNRIDLKV